MAIDRLANHFAPASRLVVCEHGEGPFHRPGTLRLARLVARIAGHSSCAHLAHLADQYLFFDRPDLLALSGRESKSGHDFRLPEGTQAL